MKNLLLTIVIALASFVSTLAQDYSQIYIIGGALPNGWDNQKAEKMNLVKGSDAVFEWEGNLKASDFKFLNTLGSWDHCFHATIVDDPVILGHSHKIVYDNPYGDYKFKISSAGTYKVVVDLKNLTMVVTALQSDLPTNLWITGSAVPGGTQKLINYPSSFKYFGSLQEGELKLMTTAEIGSDTRFIVPVAEDIDVVNSGSKVKYTSDANAIGWGVSFAETTYRLDADLFSSTMKGELFTPWSGLYIVGGCTEIGWAADKSLPFTKVIGEDNVYTWTGELKNRTENEESKSFKLLGQQDWGPNNLHPYIAGESILTSTKCLENSGDDKWQIGEDGTYTIKVNLFYETIECKYEAASADILSVDDVYVTAFDGGISVRIVGSSATVNIFDTTGRLVASKLDVSDCNVASGLSSGLYIVKIEKEGKSVMKKIMLKE